MSSTHFFLLFLKWSLSNGTSVRESVQKFVQENSNKSKFAEKLDKFNHEYIGKGSFKVSDLNSEYQKNLIHLVEKGLSGVPIQKNLLELEEEVLHAVNIEVDEFASTLGLKILIPLMVFVFPSFLILVFQIFIHFIQESI